jgi:hypothetical protein
LRAQRDVGEYRVVISGVIVHLANDLPVLVDLDELPAATDRMLRCSNVRTVDGKRPAFVHDRASMFLFPLHVIRFVEVPQTSESTAVARQDDDDRYGQEHYTPEPPQELDPIDEEADEGLLARIRSI